MGNYFNFKYYFLILLVLSCFILFSSLLLIRQSDFKSLVAYSSVLHISFCSFRLLNFNFIRSFGGIFIRLCHGFVSPLIFLFVYYFYQIFNFRKIFILIFTFTYLLNLRFPLLGGFISELLIFVLVLIKRFLLLNFILLLSFVLPIIFTFSTIIIFSKFYSLNFNNFKLNFSNLLSF